MATKSILMPIRNFTKALERDSSTMKSLPTTSHQHSFRPHFLRVPPLTSSIFLDCLNSSWTLCWSSRITRLSSLRSSTLMLSLSTSSSLAQMVSLALSSLLVKCWISERLTSSTESRICFLLASWVCQQQASALKLNCKTTKVVPKLNATQLLILWCNEPHSQSKQWYLPGN